MWILLLVVAAAGTLILFASWYRFCTSALVVVHPWNFGTNLAEVERRITKLSQLLLPEGTTLGTALQRTQLVDKHTEYYKRLARGLRRCFCRYVILCEEPERQAESYKRVRELVQVPILDWIVAPIVQRIPQLELYIKPRFVIVVDSKAGRATPLGGDWKTLYATLRRIGIRRVYFAGSYLGLRNSQVIPPTQREYYCINDAVTHAVESGLFAAVQPLEPYCFVHYPPAIESSAQPRQLPRSTKQTSKEKKKRKKR